MNVPEPSYKLTFNGKDVTNDLSPYCMSFEYVNNLHGKADEIIIEVDNSDMRFLNEWYLAPGISVQAWIGQMYCGAFMIDEPVQSGPPHIASFKAQSAAFSGPIRIKNSFTHSQKTLAAIVQHYAKTYKLKVIGSIPNITLNVMVQYREPDIDFLHKLADTYGCYCTIKGSNLIFDMLENLWKKPAAKTIHFKDVKNYHFVSSLADTADLAVSSYYNPDQDKVNGSVINSQNPYKQPTLLPSRYKSIKTGDINSNPCVTGTGFADFAENYDVPSSIIKVCNKKAESQAEADRLAIGELWRHKHKKHRSTITVLLNELLVAGNSINLLEFGKRSGYWLIKAARHKIIKKGGALTTMDLIHGAATTGAIAPPPEQIINRAYNVQKNLKLQTP